MGGNAFPSLNPSLKRISSEDYEKIKQYILQLIQPKVICVHVPFHILDKKDFGDLDILLVLREDIDREDFDNFIITNFNSGQYVTKLQGGEKSFLFNVSGFPKFQIDISYFNDISKFNMKSFYTNHSEFGSIMGHIAHSRGFKFGQDGIFVKAYYNQDVTRPIGQITVCNDIQEICNFFGLDFKLLNNNFKTKQHFFEFMTTCTLFDPTFFINESNFNYNHRSRMTKRPIYLDFVSFLKDKYPNIKEKIRTDYEKTRLELVSKFGYLDQYNQLFINYERKLVIRDKFNGKLVIELLPSLNGINLKKFINLFKKITNEEEIYNMKKEEVVDKIKKLYKSIYDIQRVYRGYWERKYIYQPLHQEDLEYFAARNIQRIVRGYLDRKYTEKEKINYEYINNYIDFIESQPTTRSN